jgi:integrase
MFERVNDRAGTAATLHSLRHTAAYRMAEDPSLPLTDVQAVVGHAQLTTAQIYLTPLLDDTAEVRRELRGLLADWLIADGDTWQPPLRTAPAAIIHWSPR